MHASNCNTKWHEITLGPILSIYNKLGCLMHPNILYTSGMLSLFGVFFNLMACTLYTLLAGNSLLNSWNGKLPVPTVVNFTIFLYLFGTVY